MPRPAASEYADFYAGYVGLVPEADILPPLAAQLADTLAFLHTIAEPDSLARHAPYTWSAKEVVGHIIDAERIFAYRALRVGRGDPTPLPGFDENAYMPAAAFDRLPFAALVEEFEIVRRSTLCLFQNLPADAWDRRGTASAAEITVRALAYIVVGHVRHHGGILRKRFGAA